MKQEEKTTITVEATVNLPVELVWKKWTTPEDIVHWNNASKEWHTPRAEIDLRAGGKFNYRMEAKDGSIGFDFWGIFEDVIKNEYIEIQLGDGRKVKIAFSSNGKETKIVEIFDAETVNSIELQRNGWQAILNNFKKYAEAN